MSKPRDLSKLFTSNTNITTDVELISTVNSASAYALSEANDYTDTAVSTLDAFPEQSGNSGKYLSTTGSAAYWAALDLNAAIVSASAAAYASASAYTDSELASIDLSATIQTASAAAVNYLVDGAPGALNTLNELAAALGDDSSFATTITNSISEKLSASTASTTYATITSLASASAAAVSYADGLTTADVAENTNLYFTNERAVNAGSATYVLQSSQQGIINSASAAAVTAVLDGAPGALDTLNELAAALNDDASFATTITNSISEKLSASTASTTYATITSLASASAAAVSYADGLTTADVAENTNLYFTNERAVNAGSATYVLQSSQQGIINSASAAAVTAVLDGAPGALDTLNELAAALNDDASFATTVTNSLASKLSISSASSTYATKAEAQNSLDRWTKIYSGSATTILGVDDNANSLLYTPNFENLYINGILVDPSNYTATSGSTIVLSEAVGTNDVVEVIGLNAFNVANTYTTSQIDEKISNYSRWVKTLSASATVISGVDDNSLPLLYTIGNEEVYVNGILLKEVTDYATTSASSITLSEVALSGDTVEVINFTTINLASVYTKTESDTKYLTIATASTSYLTQSSASSAYLTQSSASTQYEKLIPYSSSAPASPTQGDLWVDSTVPTIKAYISGVWTSVGGGAADSDQAIIASRMFA